MNEILLIAGLALGGLALRTFASVWLRRLGIVVILAASYRIGADLLGGMAGGILVASLWILVPAFSIVFSTRRASFPLEKQLRYRHAPSAEDFPELEPMTEEFLEAGFEPQDDIGWDWEPFQQFTRLFVHRELKLQGAIHLHTQDKLLFSFISLTSRTSAQRWITWNSPFQSSMQWPPDVSLNAQTLALTVAELLPAHQAFLTEHPTTEALFTPEPDDLLRLTQEEGRRQVDYNLDVGVLQLCGNGRFTYSWKGSWYMVRQFMIDFVRLS